MGVNAAVDSNRSMVTKSIKRSDMPETSYSTLDCMDMDGIASGGKVTSDISNFSSTINIMRRHRGASGSTASAPAPL